ncbi:class I SAM-dependent methyltransferase [Haloarcula sp. CBA1130]|uniref:class I SAM-dependent methyltransferase n=1 Tax=unclassified Haloarcula TaxID=2624677 RepID=UPI0012473736|nr:MULTISPECIES: class I SAM-dependent methyltransferase [unclassified Haloarcula]KAA9395946.1 class I SAM-dependent methyltransferase [Haloarcula sp. CBA1129]KAA9400124.1 class I SAM-dependent methyltransferase [Haloarcula sp. CBA1130]
MTTWDERYRTGAYPQCPDPHSVLDRYLPTFPEGRALDIATGTGRNALPVAAAGYRVDAVDQSREGLRIARENAHTAGVEDDIEWLQADLDSFTYPASTYDLITISFYRPVDRLPDIIEALADGGCLFIQHHLRTSDDVDGGPSGDRYRFASNELLRAGLGLTVLHYDERTTTTGETTAATAQLVARKSHGSRQSYPDISE